MKKSVVVLILFLFLHKGAVLGQLISEFMPPSRVMSYEASLPAEMQRKLNRIIQERADKSMRFGQLANCTSSYLMQCYTQYVPHNDSVFFLQDYPYGNSYQYCLPAMKIVNTSRGHEGTQGNGGMFNSKKDRLSAVILDKDRLYIVNHNNEVCDISLFRYQSKTEGIHMEGNRIVFDVSARAFAEGTVPLKQEIEVTHLSSGLRYRYDLRIRFEDSISWRGKNKAIAVIPYPTIVSSDLGVVLNLTDKQISFVHFPLTIHGEGSNGQDGRRGFNGSNGTNAYTWTDKEGREHYVKGTRGQPGGAGQDGQDGTDGGQFFVMLDESMMDRWGLEGVTCWIDAGEGGRGGKGGEGGIHGSGSGYRGQASSGRDGLHGRNGKRGDFLYVIGDVQTWFKQVVR